MSTCVRSSFFVWLFSRFRNGVFVLHPFFCSSSRLAFSHIFAILGLALKVMFRTLAVFRGIFGDAARFARRGRGRGTLAVG